jgi:hypothetical protein
MSPLRVMRVRTLIAGWKGCFSPVILGWQILPHLTDVPSTRPRGLQGRAYSAVGVALSRILLPKTT